MSIYEPQERSHIGDDLEVDQRFAEIASKNWLPEAQLALPAEASSSVWQPRDYHLKAGEAGRGSPEPPWADTIARTKDGVIVSAVTEEDVLIGRFDFTNAGLANSGIIDVRRVALPDGKIVTASHVVQLAPQEREPIPLGFVCGPLGSLATEAA